MHGLYVAAAASAAAAAAAATGSGIALAWTRQQEEKISELQADAKKAGVSLKSLEQKCDSAHEEFDERLRGYRSTASGNGKRLDSTTAAVLALRRDVDWLKGLYSATTGGGGGAAGGGGATAGDGVGGTAAPAAGGGGGDPFGPVVSGRT